MPRCQDEMPDMTTKAGRTGLTRRLAAQGKILADSQSISTPHPQTSAQEKGERIACRRCGHGFGSQREYYGHIAGIFSRCPGSARDQAAAVAGLPLEDRLSGA
jgi:hypothetical protein